MTLPRYIVYLPRNELANGRGIKGGVKKVTERNGEGRKDKKQRQRWRTNCGVFAVEDAPSALTSRRIFLFRLMGSASRNNDHSRI